MKTNCPVCNEALDLPEGSTMPYTTTHTYFSEFVMSPVLRCSTGHSWVPQRFPVSPYDTLQAEKE